TFRSKQPTFTLTLKGEALRSPGRGLCPCTPLAKKAVCVSTMSTSFQSPKNPKRINRYELQKQLGQGSIGEVWKAIDLQTRREVVVKLLHADLQSDPNFMTRFDQV